MDTNVMRRFAFRCVTSLLRCFRARRSRNRIPNDTQKSSWLDYAANYSQAGSVRNVAGPTSYGWKAHIAYHTEPRYYASLAIFLATVALIAPALSAGANLKGFYIHAADDSGPVFLEHTADNLPSWKQDRAAGALLSEAGRFIDGVSIDYDWADVEQSPGSADAGKIICPPRPANTTNCFDFGYFHRQLTALAAINRQTGRNFKAIVAVSPSAFPSEPAWSRIGADLPPWLFDEAHAVAFPTITSDYNAKGGGYMANGCLPLRAVVPWDPAFLREYQKFIAAFGGFVRQEPEQLRRLVAAIKLIPLPYMDENTRLPMAVPDPAYPVCKNTHRPNGVYRGSAYPTLAIPSDVVLWHRLGYTPQRLLAAAEAVLSSYKRAFPDMPLEMTVPPVALPPIDRNGDFVTSGHSARLNIRSSSTSSLTLLQTAHRVLGNQLSVSEHALAGFRQSSALFAYSDLAYGGDDHVVGYGNAWPVSNDGTCIMTGGYRAGESQECIGPWAMQEDINEALISGGSYMVLDAEDLVRPEYAQVLAAAHGFLVQGSGGSRRLLSRAMQDWARNGAILRGVAVSGSRGQISPPASSSEAAGPPLQFIQETQSGADRAEHSVTLQANLPAGHLYAFSIFATAANAMSRNVALFANEAGSRGVIGTFALGRQVIGSVPIAVDRRGIGGPGSAQMNCPPSDEGWCLLTIQFRSTGGPQRLGLRLLDAMGGEGGDRRIDGRGELAVGMHIWGMQIEPLLDMASEGRK